VDGLRGDHDLVPNGTISTSIGLANLATIDDSDDAVDTGSGGGGGGCFIRSFQ
jgi:hypothetical protein